MRQPGLTLRRLLWRAEAVQRDAWNHTAALLATIVNCRANKPRHARKAKPEDFHPFGRGRRRRGSARMTQSEFQALKRGVKKFARRKK